MSENDSNKLGVFGAASYVIGNIIGSGIFVTPGTILQQTGSIGLSLIIWVASGLIGLLGAICYIELGTSIPESGGPYAYLYFVGWKPMAFAFMWVSTMLIYPASTAIMILTFGQYVIQAISPFLCLQRKYEEMAERLFAYLLLLALTWVNMMPLQKYAGKLQIFITCFKILSLAVIIFTGFYFLIFKGQTEAFQSSFSGSKWEAGTLVLALYGGLFAYSGWDLLSMGMEDARNPKRALFVGSFGGTVLVIIIYVATIIAYLAVLGKDSMLESSSAVAATFSQKALGDFSYAIPVIVSVVICGAVNTDIFGASRYSHAAARKSHLPSFLAISHSESGSPRSSVLVQGLVPVFVSFIGDLEQLINYVTFSVWVQHALVMVAILWIRFKNITVNENAVKIPIIFHVVFLVISVCLVVVPIYESPVTATIGVGIILSGLIIYFLFIWPTNLPKFLLIANDRSAKFFQIVLRCVMDEDFLKRQRINTIVSTNTQIERF